MSGFRSENHKHNVLDKFERRAAKVIRDAALQALKDEGFNVRRSREGELVLTETHADGEKWEHRFSVHPYAIHI